MSTVLLKIGTRTKQQVQSHAQKYQKHIEDEVLHSGGVIL